MKHGIWINCLVVIGMSLMLLGSCKKGDDKTNSFKKLETMKSSGDHITTYEYNSDGKVSKVIWYTSNFTRTGTFGYDTDTEYYTYSGDTITDSTSYNLSKKLIKSIIILNPQGYLSNLTEVFGNNRWVTTYEYDKSGHLTKRSFFNPSTNSYEILNTYTYANDNMASSTLHGDTWIYEYYLEKENMLSNDRMGMSFLGKSSKNLVKKTIYNDGTSPGTMIYMYDQDNYVIKASLTSDYGTTSWTSYTYK